MISRRLHLIAKHGDGRWLHGISHRIGLDLEHQVHSVANLVKRLALLHERGQVALLELARDVLVDIDDLLLLLV